LDGAANFRDLGGYETSDGLSLRWGVLYRSDALSQLSSADLEFLQKLGLRVVCDFRTEQERVQAPNLLPLGSRLRCLHFAIGGTQAAQSALPPLLAERLTAGAPPAELKAALAAFYCNLPFWAAAQYSRTLAEILRGELPLVFHCTAGKDRSGMFCALLLLSLGVPLKTVEADYALSNRYLAGEARLQNVRKHLEEVLPPGTRLSTDQVRAVVDADPALLRAALHAIDTQCGSFRRYRREHLALSDPALDSLRAMLLV
jgi:protein-tyrosine phosphatase